MTRQLRHSIVLLIVFLSMVLAHGSAAARGKTIGKSSAADCNGAAEKIGDLGITSMSFRGSMTYNTETGERNWYFQAEPEIHKVDPRGPAAGKLEGGDVIVAIEGLPITTRQAGRKFANVAPGENVKLTVRRGGPSRRHDDRAQRSVPRGPPDDARCRSRRGKRGSRDPGHHRREALETRRSRGAVPRARPRARASIGFARRPPAYPGFPAVRVYLPRRVRFRSTPHGSG